jgi:hypothetical protein
VVLVALSLSTPAGAATIVFNSDPFAGSNAGDPGRQIIGGELSTVFNVATDVFVFDPDFFPVGPLSFVNTNAAGLPAGGVNVVVLQEFGPPMAAGIAADLIAAQITAPGPGFFVYFNTGLNLPRLVYSTDLSTNTADLKVLARLTNLVGLQSSLATFGAANFQIQQVPEPASLVLLAAGVACCSRRLARRRSA